MVRGFYSAAAGVLSQQKSFNAISNNIANATTTGYKSQGTIESTFGEHLVSRMSANNKLEDGKIGSGAFLTANVTEYTDFTQGSMENTGRPVDMAIQGEGFFLVNSETHGQVLTRNGEFEIDKDGYLTLPKIGRVLNTNKSAIKLDGINFSVDSNGRISQEGKEVGGLYIANKIEGTKLTKVGEGAFQSPDGFELANKEGYMVLQGNRETSNINMANEMSRLISGQSHFQSCTQLLKIYDKINEITVNQIGRIG